MLPRRLTGTLLAAALLLAGLLPYQAHAQSNQPPITIGFGMAQTGGLASIGKAALLAMQIWEAETNAKGGMLGRPVKLVYYDDQSNPTNIPGIYTKLLDVDKVDLVVSGYATNMIAPAMPVVIEHKRTFLSLFGHRQLRFLDPGKDLAVSRRHGISEEVSGKAVRGASIR